MLAKEIILANYISNLQGNWDTKGSSYNISGDRDNAVESEGNDNIVEKQRKDLENNEKIVN